MVHVEVVVPGEVGVQDELLRLLCARIEQNVQAQREIVEEEVAASILNSFVGRRGMNFHFVLGFVKDARWGSEVGANILTAVAEENVAGEGLLTGLQRADRAFREDAQPQAFRSTRVPNDRRGFDVKLLQHAGDWKGWRFAVLNVVAAVQSHLGHHRRVARAEVQRAESVAGEVRLHLAVHVKVESQASEVEREGVLGRVVDRRMGRAERVLDLLDRWQNFGRVEMQSAVSQAHQLHVEYFYGLQALRNCIENQAQTAQWQVYYEVDVQRILKKKQRKILNKMKVEKFCCSLRVRCKELEHS